MSTTAAAKTAELLASVVGEVTDPDERAALIEANHAEARARLRMFAKTVNQGEWLTITRLLDLSREDIGNDSNLTLLALGYVKEKREHKRASLEVLLTYTDEDLLTLHGFASDPEAPDDDDEKGDQRTFADPPAGD